MGRFASGEGDVRAAFLALVMLAAPAHAQSWYRYPPATPADWKDVDARVTAPPAGIVQDYGTVNVAYGTAKQVKGTCDAWNVISFGGSLLGCSHPDTSRREIMLPNPCLWWALIGDGYAKLMCHELAHLDGAGVHPWPSERPTIAMGEK